MSDITIVAAADAAIILTVFIFREPKWLIPIVVLGLPIEYFNTQALGSLGDGGLAGAVRALLNPGKFAMVLTIVIAVIHFRHEPRRLIPDSSLVLPLLAMLAVVTLGLFWSDSLKPPNSILILPLYIAFVIVAPAFIETRQDMERIVGAFLLSAIFLGVLAAAQRTGFFNWRAGLIQSDAYSYRSNATFSDPNNLARFFAVSLSLAAGTFLLLGPRRLTIYLAVPALAAGAIGIFATASRSGWIMLLLCGFLVVVLTPIARGTKLRLVGAAVTALAVLIFISLLQGGADAGRLRSLTSGVSVIGQREFLIRAGWAMFKDNPIFGVGSGNYQHALLISYIHLIPEWAQTTLSHTSFVSILAENGLVGAFMFGFVGVRLGIAVVRKYVLAADPFYRLVAAWLGAAFVGIVLQSQSEGRLIDEPYLWLLMAIFVALETAPAFASKRELAERATVSAGPARLTQAKDASVGAPALRINEQVPDS